ncbi:MAG: glycosyltransferase family 4 protein [Gemmatimonadetes bacterium]|nr:glycosyltransferase family 4 protein [Gemmatimonadota bacterium]
MRVVFLTHNYPRQSGDLAGGFLHPLALALRDRGHDIRVVAPSDAGRGGTDYLDGIPVRRVRYASAAGEHFAYTGRMAEATASPAGWLALLRLLRGFRQATRMEAADGGDAVVHAHWWFPAGLAAPPELPTVVTLHGTDGRLLAGRTARWLARRAMAPSRLVTAVSRSVAAAAASATGRPLGSIPVQPMPLRVASVSRSRGGGGVVVVARLTAQKRVHLAIEAHQRLRLTRPDLKLTIVGDGPERARLEQLARRLGTSQAITWTGTVAPADVPGVMANADVAVLPAEAEGLGLSAVEALVGGVPVVACRDGGGVLDIMAEPGAGRVSDPDPVAIAAAVDDLLSTPAGRDRAATAGSAWLERLAPAAVAERFERWYEQVRRR